MVITTYSVEKFIQLNSPITPRLPSMQQKQNMLADYPKVSECPRGTVGILLFNIMHVKYKYYEGKTIPFYKSLSAFFEKKLQKAIHRIMK